MRKVRHPLSGAIYELDEEFNVLVTSRFGETGTFDSEGRWLGGTIRSADPEMCKWVGNGPTEPVDLSANRRFRAPDTTPDAV